MAMKKGGNVHRGTYAKGDGNCTYDQANGRHGAPKAVIGDHRKTSGVPRIKGHHFQGSGSRKTGRTFK